MSTILYLSNSTLYRRVYLSQCSVLSFACTSLSSSCYNFLLFYCHYLFSFSAMFHFFTSAYVIYSHSGICLLPLLHLPL